MLLAFARLSSAAGLVFAAALGAQTQTTATGGKPQESERRLTREVNVTGCLARGADGRYMLTGARVEPVDTDRPPATSSTSSATGTSGRTEPAGSGTAKPDAWMLTGGSDLDAHVGQRIQATGRTAIETEHRDPASTSTTTSPATTAETPADKKGPELEVQAIKVVSATCS